jgi:hypothetical protein
MIDTVRVTVKLSSYWLSFSQVTSSGDLRVCEFPNGRLILSSGLASFPMGGLSPEMMNFLVLKGLEVCGCFQS